MIEILFVLEERQLLLGRGIFRNGAAHHDKAMKLVPSVVNFLPELPDLPTVAQLFESAASCSSFDVGVLPGYDHVSTSYFVEEADHLAPVKPGIHAQADTACSDVLGHFGQADFEESNGSRSCHRVARSQRAMPELLEVGLEAKQRMIRAPSRFLGVVAYLGPFLSPIDHDHHGIQIEHQSGALVGQSKEISPQAVVESSQLADGLWRQTFEESAQGGLIGESSKPEHLQEDPVVLQDIGLVDTPEPHDDGKHQSYDHFGRVVRSAAVWNSHVLLDEPTKSELVAKTLNQPHATEMGKVGFVECKMNFAGAFGHMAQSTP